LRIASRIAAANHGQNRVLRPTLTDRPCPGTGRNVPVAL
jgi:hypothetical protein